MSGHKMLPGQDQQRNALHLWTLKLQAKAVSNGVSIHNYSCPLLFRCNCRVGMRVVEGGGLIQFERRGLHHINSHVRLTMDDGNDEPQDLIDESEEDDDFDDNHDSYDEDDSDDEDNC